MIAGKKGKSEVSSQNSVEKAKNKALGRPPEGRRASLQLSAEPSRSWLLVAFAPAQTKTKNLTAVRLLLPVLPAAKSTSLKTKALSK
jgi:hypothetical protein